MLLRGYISPSILHLFVSGNLGRVSSVYRNVYMEGGGDGMGDGIFISWEGQVVNEMKEYMHMER